MKTKNFNVASSLEVNREGYQIYSVKGQSHDELVYKYDSVNDFIRDNENHLHIYVILSKSNYKKVIFYTKDDWCYKIEYSLSNNIVKKVYFFNK